MENNMFLHIYVSDFHYIVKFTEPLSSDEMSVLFSLTGGTESSPEPMKLMNGYVEYGPRPPTMSPWCTNVLCILKSLGIMRVTSLERYKIIKEEFLSEIDFMTEEILRDGTCGSENCAIGSGCCSVDSISDFNKMYNLSMDDHDISEYEKYFLELGRRPTVMELYDLGQANSEHSRHHLFSGAIIKKDSSGNDYLHKSMFQLVKNTLNNDNIENSVVAFKDNSSAIKGYNVVLLRPQFQDSQSVYQTVTDTYHTTFTAETHNFPTGIAPFQGATTGTGGRIRDTQCIGKGGQTIAGTVGYCVGNLPPIPTGRKRGSMFKEPLDILIEASNGASDYGNKFGEPVILGFTRSGLGSDYEWVKPIMFCGGIGQVRSCLVEKDTPEYGDVIVRMGGPAYRIGVGGGSASSRSEVNKYDYSAVQRGDPEMECKLNRVIRSCCEMDVSPIRSIHDQGAGGMANVTREISMPLGGIVHLDRVKTGDPSLTPLEIWVSEHQEQNTALVRLEDLEKVKKIGIRERVEITPVGHITGTGTLEVKYHGKTVSNVGEIKTLRKDYEINDVTVSSIETVVPGGLEFRKVLDLVLSDLSVGSKRFLTNKVDRSVTGLVAQQQCVGPYHTPLSDYGVIAHSHFSSKGAVTAIGEQPTKGVQDIYSMAEMTVGELVTNIMWAKIDGGLNKIKCSLNWMWPAGTVEEKSRMYETVKHISSVLTRTGIAVDGGKDSVSMTADGVKSPGSVVISGYAPMLNVRTKVTPEFKEYRSNILFINLSKGKSRIGGSVFSRVTGSRGNCPRLESVIGLERLFEMMQYFVRRGFILSGHDVSDGGMITCLLEMSFASGIGIDVRLPEHYGIQKVFSEELGCIIEVSNSYYDIVMECLEVYKEYWDVYNLGHTVDDQYIRARGDQIVLVDTIQKLRSVWESTSFALEKMQCDSDCVDLERLSLERKSRPKYNVPGNSIVVDPVFCKDLRAAHVAIIREEGTNGDRELASAFSMAGFSVWDVSMQDIIMNKYFTFDGFSGIAFAGGFSYSDVFGAAEGWSKSILLNPHIKKLFDNFRNREDTFSLGVCNGCQLMSKLGWVSGKFEGNVSGRFESRFSTVTIEKSNSIMLKDLEGMVFGIWVAHGEGKYTSSGPSESVVTPIKYSDDNGCPTSVYPYCPNGSEGGVAAVVSDDGRHLAMMPHPERSFIDWQVPWCSNESLISRGHSPWFRIFKNAYYWCQN